MRMMQSIVLKAVVRSPKITTVDLPESEKRRILFMVE